MYISLVIATFKRHKEIKTLLRSILLQNILPDEIIVVDSSEDNLTEEILQEFIRSLPVKYFRVSGKDRGTAQQRNYGILRASDLSEIIFFLDDDVVLEPNYFEEIISTYISHPSALGVSGYDKSIISTWKELKTCSNISNYFVYDGWCRKFPLRHMVLKFLNLEPAEPPGFMPSCSHGLSITFLPPSGKIYRVEFYGTVTASFKTNLLKRTMFSDYFSGYGLYEDLDLCLRISRHGELYVNTNARLDHYHAPSGRPNRFKYGIMVVRNGWYVWRVKYDRPIFTAKFKWWAITWVLATIRLCNSVTGPLHRQAFTEAMGRYYGMISLIISPPKVIR